MRVPPPYRMPLHAYAKYVNREFKLWTQGALRSTCEGRFHLQRQSQKGSTSAALIKAGCSDALGQACKVQSLGCNLSTRLAEMRGHELGGKRNRLQMNNHWTEIADILLDMHVKLSVAEGIGSNFNLATHGQYCQKEDAILADVEKVCSIIEQGSFCNVEEMLDLLPIKVTPDIVYQVLEKLLKCGKAPVKTTSSFFEWAAKQPGFKHTSNTFGMMVKILARRRKFDTMWIVIENMRKEGCSLTSKTVAIVIASLGKAGLVEIAARAFNQLETFGCKTDTTVYNALICVYSKAGHIEIVQQLYTQMISEGCPPDTATYNIIIYGFCRGGELRRAQEVFYNMLKHGFVPDIYTYNIFLDNLLRADDRDGALDLLEDMQIRGCAPNSVTFTCMVHKLCKTNQLNEAWKLWGKMVELGGSCIPTCNVLLQALCRAQLVDDACRFLNDMRKHEMAPNLTSYNMVLHSLCRAKRINEAERLFNIMLDEGCNPDVATYTSLINGFCQTRLLLHAYSLWISIAIKHLDTYTVFIHGLCKAGEVREASNLMEEMIENNVIPDLPTFEMVAFALDEAGMPDIVRKLRAKVSMKVRFMHLYG